MRSGPSEQWNDGRTKTGFSWFSALLFRRFWDFFRANLILLAGIFPGILLTIWGIWGHSFPVVLLGGAVGGLAGGPLLCGLYGTILRALREEPGFWSLSYKRTLKQNWRDALMPGAVFGLLLSLWLFVAVALGVQGPVSLTTVFILAEVLFFVLGLSAYLFPQIIMVRVSTRNIYFNSIRLFIGLLPRSAASAAAQTVYWGGFLLLLPRSVPALIVTGFWFPSLLSMILLRRPMEERLYSDKEVE